MKARGLLGATVIAGAASCAQPPAHGPEASTGVSAAACLAETSTALQDLTAADPNAAQSILAGVLQAKIIELGGDPASILRGLVGDDFGGDAPSASGAAPSQPDWAEAARTLDLCALS